MVTLETKKGKYELFMKKLKPIFHMIATIAVIAAIAEKNKFSDRIDQMETTIPAVIAATTIKFHLSDRCRYYR